MVYAKFGGQTECIMGNWKIENEIILQIWSPFKTTLFSGLLTFLGAFSIPLFPHVYKLSVLKSLKTQLSIIKEVEI